MLVLSILKVYVAFNIDFRLRIRKTVDIVNLPLKCAPRYFDYQKQFFGAFYNIKTHWRAKKNISAVIRILKRK